MCIHLCLSHIIIWTNFCFFLIEKYIVFQKPVISIFGKNQKFLTNDYLYVTCNCVNVFITSTGDPAAARPNPADYTAESTAGGANTPAPMGNTKGRGDNMQTKGDTSAATEQNTHEASTNRNLAGADTKTTRDNIQTPGANRPTRRDYKGTNTQGPGANTQGPGANTQGPGANEELPATIPRTADADVRSAGANKPAIAKAVEYIKEYIRSLTDPQSNENNDPENIENQGSIEEENNVAKEKSLHGNKKTKKGTHKGKNKGPTQEHGTTNEQFTRNDNEGEILDDATMAEEVDNLANKETVNANGNSKGHIKNLVNNLVNNLANLVNNLAKNEPDNADKYPKEEVSNESNREPLYEERYTRKERAGYHTEKGRAGYHADKESTGYHNENDRAGYHATEDIIDLTDPQYSEEDNLVNIEIEDIIAEEKVINDVPNKEPTDGGKDTQNEGHNVADNEPIQANYPNTREEVNNLINYLSNLVNKLTNKDPKDKTAEKEIIKDDNKGELAQEQKESSVEEGYIKNSYSDSEWGSSSDTDSYTESEGTSEWGTSDGEESTQETVPNRDSSKTIPGNNPGQIPENNTDKPVDEKELDNKLGIV